MRRELILPSRLEKTAKLPYRIMRGKLAEKYDGIGQYVLVNIAGSSTSGAVRARVATGDFGGGRVIPRGTPVTLTTKHGFLEVFLGNLDHLPCMNMYLCCPGLPEGYNDCNAFNAPKATAYNYDMEAFSEIQGNTFDKLWNGVCGNNMWGGRPWGGGGIITIDLEFTKSRAISTFFSSEYEPGANTRIIDQDDSTYWMSSVLGNWVGIDLGTPRPISQFRLLQGPNPPVEGGVDVYAEDFSIWASVDGGVTYTDVHRSIGAHAAEVSMPLRAGTIIARHWIVNNNHGLVTGAPWRVYALDLMDAAGKNWADPVNSPETVYDERRANWIYIYGVGGLVNYMDLWVDDVHVMQSQHYNTWQYFPYPPGNPCGGNTDGLYNTHYFAWNLGRVAKGHHWVMDLFGWPNPSIVRMHEILAFKIPDESAGYLDQVVDEELLLIRTGLGESVIQDMDLNIGSTTDPVYLDFVVWTSVVDSSGNRYTTVRVRRDDIDGEILGTATTLGNGASSAAGHSARNMASLILDSSPTTGHYVLTLEYSSGTAAGQVWSDERRFTVREA